MGSRIQIADIAVVSGRFNANKQLRIKSPQSLPAVIGKELAQQEKRTSDNT